MSQQQFTGTDEEWQPKPFKHDGIIIVLQNFAGKCHADTTTLFFSNRNANTYHADKHCHHLHQSDPFECYRTGELKRTLWIRPLEDIVTTWEFTPCDNCTRDIEQTEQIAIDEGIPEHNLQLEGDVV